MKLLFDFVFTSESFITNPVVLGLGKGKMVHEEILCML